MIRTSALIVGLLVLGGCAQSKEYIEVTFKAKNEPCRIICTYAELDSLQFECQGIPMVDGCTDDGQALVRRTIKMESEEFRIRYNGIKSFRDSIASYSFQ